MVSNLCIGLMSFLIFLPRMFTIGSSGFLYADLNEWWLNNRAGCAFDEEYREEFERQVGSHFGPSDSLWGQYLRKENGLNFALSCIGSLLYLIGSILFIPRLNAIVLGTQIFIYGSLVIFLAQAWKVYRQGCHSETNLSVREFKLQNYEADLPALGVDACAGLGGLSYMIGSIYFLPEYDISDSVTVKAATLFTIGGVFFTLSGLFMIYRYFFTLKYFH